MTFNSANKLLRKILGFKNLIVTGHDLRPPGSFRGMISCPNATCIVHVEGCPGSWSVARTDPVVVRCLYCDREVATADAEFL